MNRLTISRRRLLASLGLATAATLPVFRTGIRHASANDTIPQRFLGVYHPAGWRLISRDWVGYSRDTELYNNYVYPGRRRNADYALSSIRDPWPEETAPLKRIQEHLVFVEGLHNWANRGPNNHMAGVHTMLSGADPARSFQSSGGMTLDYYLARNKKTPFSGVNLSVGAWSELSQSGLAQRVQSDIDPLRAYERYFASLIQDGSTQERLAKIREARVLRKSVLDHSIGELKNLKPWIPSHDIPRFEAHMEGIRSMELRLDALAQEGPQCKVPQPSMLDHKNNANIPAVTDVMHDIIVNALACRLAHTATFAFGRGTLSFTPTFLGMDENYHAMSHYNFKETEKQTQYTNLLNWTSDKVASLLEKLDAVPEEDGKSLLHHALMLWSTDNSSGMLHRVDDVPFILAGQAGGKLNTGRVVSYKHGTKHNRLLVSVAQAFGENINAFGTKGFSEGGALDRLFVS